jgi:ATPase subunit of ABC transporter with duplicated ATPase domains
VLTVSHDRAFLRRCDRFLLLDRDGTMLALPTYEAALAALTEPELASSVPLAKRL